MRDLVRKMLSYRTRDLDRDSMIMAATAFADRIIGRGRYGLSTYKIDLDMMDNNRYGVKTGKNSYALWTQLYQKNNFANSLITTFHEVSHIINDKPGPVISPTTLKSLIAGVAITLNPQENKRLCELNRIEMMGNDLSEDEQVEYNNLMWLVNRCSEIIKGAYYYQPQEVRARAWANATMRQFLDIAGMEDADGMLDDIQSDNLARIQKQYEWCKKREIREKKEYILPTLENITWLKRQFDKAKDMYLERLPKYLAMPSDLRSLLQQNKVEEDPVDYLTEYLLVYYDKELADRLVPMLLETGDEKDICMVVDILAYTPYVLQEEEEKVFRDNVEGLIIHDCPNMSNWDYIMEHKEMCSAQLDNMDMLRPDKYTNAINNISGGENGAINQFVIVN